MFIKWLPWVSHSTELEDLLLWGSLLSGEQWKSITYIGFHEEMLWEVTSHGLACLARVGLDAGELCRIQMS